jgi:hypothetical protein
MMSARKIVLALLLIQWCFMLYSMYERGVETEETETAINRVAAKMGECFDEDNKLVPLNSGKCVP